MKSGVVTSRSASLPVKLGDSKAKRNLSELKKLAQQASQVFLATDQDREGEGISFHLKEALGLRSYQRVTYNEVTDKDFLTMRWQELHF